VTVAGGYTSNACSLDPSGASGGDACFEGNLDVQVNEGAHAGDERRCAPMRRAAPHAPSPLVRFHPGPWTNQTVHHGGGVGPPRRAYRRASRRPRGRHRRPLLELHPRRRPGRCVQAAVEECGVSQSVSRVVMDCLTPPHTCLPASR
jgi:hypothetical protein